MGIMHNTLYTEQLHTSAPSTTEDLDVRDRQIVTLAGQLSPGNVYDRPAVR
jgi:hypothetical protein